MNVQLYERLLNIHKHNTLRACNSVQLMKKYIYICIFFYFTIPYIIVPLLFFCYGSRITFFMYMLLVRTVTLK